MLMKHTVPPVLRALIRHVPPRRRGIRLAHTWTRWSTPDDHLFVSRESSGLRLRCDLRDELSRVVYYRGSVDRAVERWLATWLRPGDLYVDVGAHIGSIVSLAASAVGPTGRIVAFEPSPDTLAKLRQAVNESGWTNIEVRPEAIGAAAGTAEILAPLDHWAHQACRASLVPASGLGGGVRVPTVSLDEAFGDGGRRIRLLKIDVEGHERSVLRGARQLLSGRRCDAVLLELNPGALAGAGATVDDLVADMDEAGYEPFRVEPDGTPRSWRPAVPADTFADAVFLPR
jgi:FkbM family methyltransferase